MSLRKKLMSFLCAKPSIKWLTEVEYIKNNFLTATTSCPIIDTGIVNTWDEELIVTATISKSLGNRIIICGGYPEGRTFNFEVAGGNATRLYCSNASNIDPTYTTVDKYGGIIPEDVVSKVWIKCTPVGDAAHTINYEIGIEALDGSFKYISTGSFYRSGSAASTKPLRLFFDYRPGLDTSFDGGFKLYQIEIKNGTNHKKFVPCLDLNNVPAMYDTIGKQLYYNARTGDFSVGRTITEVEWMHLTGTQYFNTGLKPNTLATTLKTKYTFEGTAMMMGCRNTSASYNEMCSIYMPAFTTSRPYSRIRLDWMAGTNGMFTDSLTSELTELEITGNYAKVNGVEYTDTTKTSVDITVPFYIGGTFTVSSAAINYPQTGKVYYASLLNTTTRELYRYCVPAHDENNVGFFFDRVNHFIMDNVGTKTDNLTWGDDIQWNGGF